MEPTWITYDLPTPSSYLQRAQKSYKQEYKNYTNYKNYTRLASKRVWKWNEEDWRRLKSCSTNTTPQANEVNNYLYLGQLVSATENQMCKINRRAKMGWSAFGRLSMVLKGKLPLRLKRKVFDQCVLPVLTYGCETWTLNAKMTQKLQMNRVWKDACWE